MDALPPRNFISKDTAVVTLADRLGISRTRAIQFLNLARIPSDLRGRLREMADLTESRLCGVVKMNPAKIGAAVVGLGVFSQAG